MNDDAKYDERSPLSIHQNETVLLKLNKNSNKCHWSFHANVKMVKKILFSCMT